MLVLTRGIGDSIKIGDDIELHILDIQRGQVRIGIAAPKDVNIVRTELLARVRDPKPEAMRTLVPVTPPPAIERPSLLTRLDPRPTLKRRRLY